MPQKGWHEQQETDEAEIWQDDTLQHIDGLVPQVLSRSERRKDALHNLRHAMRWGLRWRSRWGFVVGVGERLCGEMDERCIQTQLYLFHFLVHLLHVNNLPILPQVFLHTAASTHPPASRGTFIHRRGE